MRNGFNPLTMSKSPFRCRHCHEYNHLWRNCPKLILAMGTSDHRHEGEAEKDGFTQVKKQRRSNNGGTSKAKKEWETKTHRSKNPFEVLGKEMMEGDTSKERNIVEQQEGM